MPLQRGRRFRVRHDGARWLRRSFVAAGLVSGRELLVGVEMRGVDIAGRYFGMGSRAWSMDRRPYRWMQLAIDANGRICPDPKV